MTHVHDAGFYASDADFLALITPFVEEGLASGEAVVTGYDDRKTALLRDVVGDQPGLTSVPDRTLYATPARAIHGYAELFARYVADGAPRVRIAGDVPHAGNGGDFAGWDRYECAVNVVWDRFPVRSLCLYDTRTASPSVVDVVNRTHRHLQTRGRGREANDGYVPVDRFRVEPLAPDPLERTAPAVELVDVLPTAARHRASALARDVLDPRAFDDLLLGVSEAVSNATVHGRAPVTVRMWARDGRVVVTVSDAGVGPADMLAGLRPPRDDRVGGRGLWLVHQLCDDVGLAWTWDGFTVRIRAGEAPPAAPASPRAVRGCR